MTEACVWIGSFASKYYSILGAVFTLVDYYQRCGIDNICSTSTGIIFVSELPEHGLIFMS